MNMDAMIRQLIGREPLPSLLVGGKAANLNRLAALGYDVPPGFVVTTAAYDDFLAANGLKDLIIAGLLQLETGEPEDMCREIQNRIEKASLPESLLMQLEGSAVNLAADAVAVRSSAVNEDLPGASFAGLLDSFLDVSGGDMTQLALMIKKCFASLYNSGAVLYRRHKGFDQHMGIAVICQKMVAPDFAGVLFTRDPLEKKNILLEIAAGSGEKVVSGMVTPNSYLVCRDTFNILEADESECPSIPAEYIRRLAQTGLDIEHRFNAHQDIEFALLDDRIWLLQARHITTPVQ